MTAGTPIADPGISRDATLVTPPSGFPNWPCLNPTPPVWQRDALVLPVPGFYVFGDGGRTRVIMATGCSPALNAGIAFSFVTGAVTGRPDENDAFYADPDAFAAALFERPGACHMNCGPTAIVLGILLAAMGIKSRLLQWVGTDDDLPFHQSLEVAIPRSGWTLYDPHFGVAYRPGVSGLFAFETLLSGAGLGPHIQHYLPKLPTWVEPWNPCRGLLAGVGVFEAPGHIVMRAGDLEQFRARWRGVGLALTLLTPEEFRVRCYGRT